MIVLLAVAVLLLLAGAVLLLGLRGSHGHLPALLRGQFEPAGAGGGNVVPPIRRT